jgi:hypothetical protein
MQVQDVLNAYIDTQVSVKEDPAKNSFYSDIFTCGYKVVYAGLIIGRLFKRIEATGGELIFERARRTHTHTHICNQIEHALNSKHVYLELKKAIRIDAANKERQY